MISKVISRENCIKQKWGGFMNKTKVPTMDKVSYLLRLTPSTYKKIRARVEEIREVEGYSYSINDFLTELIEKGLKEKR